MEPHKHNLRRAAPDGPTVLLTWTFEAPGEPFARTWSIDQEGRHVQVCEGPVGKTPQVTAYVARDPAAAAALCARWRREKEDEGFRLVGEAAEKRADEAERLRKALLQAIHQEDVPRVRELLASGADLDPFLWPGSHPLVDAAETGNVDLVQVLLLAGADPNHYRDVPPLWVAAGVGHGDVVEVLLDARTEIDQENDDGGTPLIQAAFAGHIAVVRRLVERGAAVHHVGRHGDDALAAAARGGRQAVYDFLLPLAREERRPRAVALLAEGLELRRTAAAAHPRAWQLFGAIYDGDLQRVHELLADGVPAEARDADGALPLHAAAAAGRLTIADALLAAGAGVDAADPHGRTALMAAVEGQSCRVTERLVAVGAAVDARDRAGVTAMAIACEQHRLGAPDGERLLALLEGQAAVR